MRSTALAAPLLAAVLVVTGAAPAAAAAPDTLVTSGPADGAKVLPGPVQYTFEAVGSSDFFECSVDGSAFTTCTSPQTFDLPYGSHIFQVRAVSGGDVDATPALRQWIVRNVACEEAELAYLAARASYYGHLTRKGYLKEKLQRAKEQDNQVLIEKYRKKVKRLNKKIRADIAAMAAAEVQQQAAC